MSLPSGRLLTGAVWLCGAVVAISLKPPQGSLSSEPTGPEGWLAVQSIFLLTVAIAVVAVGMVQWADTRHFRVWLIASAVTGGSVVWLTITFFDRISAWHCPQKSGVWKIVGDPSALRDDAKQNMAKLGVANPCAYLWQSGGNVEEIWMVESVLPRRITISRLYRPIAALFSCLILSAGHAWLIKRAARPKHLIPPALVAARANLRIFINYRKRDTEDAVDSLYNYLIRYFDPGNIFRDKEGIPAGSKYEEKIMAALEASDVFLAVIGPGWLTMTNEEGCRRVEEASDLLRREIERALEKEGMTVIPLLHNTAMPEASELPATLAALAQQQARPLRSEPDLKHDQARLLETLDATALAKAHRPTKTG